MVKTETLRGATRVLGITLALVTSGVLSGCSWTNDGAVSGDWIGYGRDEGEQRFSPLAEIDVDNVRRLGLAWSLDLPGENALEATPLAIDGILYFSGTFGAVYAVDAVGGKALWKYDPQANQVSPRGARKVFGAHRGVAYWDNKVYVATKDGRMIALDARTGKPIWTSQFLVPGDLSASSGAPRVFDGKIIIGNSGAELGARGYVTTLDARTGKILWRFYTVPGNPATDTDETTRLAAKTWSGDWWRYGGGGTPWNAITYDAEFNQILVGTGNGSPWNPRFRCYGKEGESKDNLFLASVVALDAKTGKYKWHFQYNPCESWDYKATMDITLADLKIGGKPRKVMMQAPTNGFFYVIDRSNGKLISAQKIGKVNWADRIDLKTGRPVERAGIRYQDGPVTMYPSGLGSHNWQSMSYNPVTGLVYIPYMQLGMKVSASPTAEADVAPNPNKVLFRLGTDFEIVTDPKDPLDGTGSLLAWDPVAQKLKWRVDHPFLWNGGTMTTAGNLVFQGTSTGQLYAFDAANGRQVWSFDAKLGIIAPPITYRAKGKQYVSILVGYGASADGAIVGMKRGWKYGLQPRRLLTFALDGKAKLPETAPPDFSVNAMDDSKIVVDPRQAQAGMMLYHRVCGACHGSLAIAAGEAPDLRESGVPFDRKAFAQFLHQAPLLEHGMGRFDDLSDAEIGQLYHYIRWEARNYRDGKALDSASK